MSGLILKPEHTTNFYIDKFYAPHGQAPKPGQGPKEIAGDAIYLGTQIDAHRYPGEKIPDRGFVIKGKFFDLYVDFTPPLGINVPLIYHIEHGIDTRDVPAMIIEHRMRVVAALQGASNEQHAKVLKDYAFTNENIQRLNVKRGVDKAIPDVTAQAARAADPKNHAYWDDIGRYYQGYKGELHPNAKMRAIYRVLYRPVIMYKAMLRTMRNPDEIGSKGTRTFWSNVPTAIAVSVIVAAITLAALKHQDNIQKHPVDQAT